MAVSAHSSSIPTRWHRAVRNRIPTVVTIVALLAIWQVWVAVAHPDPALIASPTDIAASVVRTWPTLGPATWTTAYEGLCGHRPFTGATPVDIAAAHVNNPVPPLPASVDFQLSQFVMSMLSKDPLDRPNDALTVARILTRIQRRLLHPVVAIKAGTSLF